MHNRAVSKMEMKVNLILSILRGLISWNLELKEHEELKNKYISIIDELFSEYSGLFIQGQAYFLVNTMKEIEYNVFSKNSTDFIFVVNFILDVCNKQLIYVSDKRFELWLKLKQELYKEETIKLLEEGNKQIIGRDLLTVYNLTDYEYLWQKIDRLRL